MPQDTANRLAEARRRYVAAVAARDLLPRGHPGYHEAVRNAGHWHGMVGYWQRRLARDLAGDERSSQPRGSRARSCSSTPATSSSITAG